MVELQTIDKDLVAGRFGEASAAAMRLLIRYGDALNAKRFVSIESVHIDSCLFHGQSSIDFVRRFAELGARVRVPTTLNVAAVDVTHPGWFRGDPDVITSQLELTRLYEEIGCQPTLTCAPYQRMQRPELGEHVAWAESNAIVFVNSVLGARTDRYGDFTDLCAALTGRVPLRGLHLDENRRADVLVEVAKGSQGDLSRDIYFACLGYALGKAVGDQVPVLTNVTPSPTEDEMKALGAAAASSGSLALFHIAGVTPEAPTVSAIARSTGPRAPRVRLSARDINAALLQLCPLSVGEPIAAVCLGTPHFSLTEFGALTSLVCGRIPANGVEVYVSTSREIAAIVETCSEFGPLRGFGIKIIVDTCTYLAPVVKDGHLPILTNSAKWAHYGPGNLGRRAGLMSLERCIRSAVLGAVAEP